MWLVTTFGYFSIVQKHSDRDTDTLTVRCRVRQDMELLKQKYLPNLGPIQARGGADYPYRAKVRRADLADAFRQAIMDLSYSNFKAEVALQLGHRREDLYTDVWMSLRALQSVDPETATKPAAPPVLASAPRSI